MVHRRGKSREVKELAVNRPSLAYSDVDISLEQEPSLLLVLL